MAAFRLTTPTLILSNCLSNVQSISKRYKILQEYQMSCQTASSFLLENWLLVRRTWHSVSCVTAEKGCHTEFPSFVMTLLTTTIFKYFFILTAVLLSHLSSVTENWDSCVCWLNSQTTSRWYSASLPRAQAQWWGSKDREERGRFSWYRYTAHT